MSFGQQALIDNIDGQWCIYRDGKRQFLDPQIQELGNFDAQGLTYFMRFGKYGVVNEEGTIVLTENYGSVSQLGGGYFVLLKDKKQTLATWRHDQFVFSPINDFEKLQDNWSQVSTDSTTILINWKGKKEWVLSGSDRIYDSDFGHTLCRINDSICLFDPEGRNVNAREEEIAFTEDYLLINSTDLKKFIFRNHEVLLPTDARNIRLKENQILYAQSGSSTIISSLDGKVISYFPYENVEYYKTSVLRFYQARKVGLISTSGKIIIPAKYTMITETGDVYMARSTNGVGVLDQNGKVLVSCGYDYIRVYADFFEVHNSLGLVGVVSRKTNNDLLPCTYQKIMLSDTVLRAFSLDMLRMLEIDSNHRVVNDLVLSNVTSLVNSKASLDISVDKRLFPLGWFVERVPIFDQDGYRTGDQLKWGLKDQNDSLLIPARNKEPLYVENADFSLQPRGKRELSIYGWQKAYFPQFEVTSHRTGKSLISEHIINLDTMDLMTRNYARFISSKGLGVLKSDNSILRVNYIDGHDVNFVRFCTSKKTELLAADKFDVDKVHMPDYDLNNDPDRFMKVNINKKGYEWVRYNNAEWNFLDTNGKVVFSEPFDFVEPYKFETAIVLKNGKWGVVRADSFLIPNHFLSVKRSPISDTLFVVQRRSNGLRYLDTNGRLMPKEMTRFFKNKGDMTQVEWNKNKSLVNLDYEVISGETHFQKLLENDIFFSKENKQYTIYTSEGIQLGEVPLRPEEVWFEKYVKVKSRGKLGVLSVDGDTLIPFRYKEIDQLGDYIFAQDRSDNLLFNSELEQVDKLKTYTVLVDLLTGNYAEIHANKAILHSPTEGRLASVKGTKFERYHNGFLIEMGKQLKVFSPEKELVFDFEPISLEVMDQNGYLVEDKDKVTHYFDENWQEIEFEEPLGRVKYVGNGLALSRTRTHTLLFGGDLSVKLKANTRNVGMYESGFLLTEANRQYQFINLEGENEFKRTYKEAKPFIAKYATVKEKDGWTIIDRKGNYQVLPGFDEISAESPTIFATRAQPLLGLYDAHGNELIPAEYQQLNFLRNDLIQGRKDGNIFYFDRSGKPILMD